MELAEMYNNVIFNMKPEVKERNPTSFKELITNKGSNYIRN